MSDRRHTARGHAWSRCSLAQLRHFLASGTASCLLTAPHSLGLSLLASEAPSARAQCEARHGPGSRSCREAGLCTQLFCSRPRGGGCVSYHPAVEGTRCAPGAKCSSGECVKTSAIQEESEQRTSSIQKESGQRTSSIQKIKEKVTNKESPSVRKTLNTISDDCHDRTRISVKGVTSCNTLLRNFGHNYCDNKYVARICCASRALFCDQ